jgi:hypothetical protein
MKAHFFSDFLYEVYNIACRFCNLNRTELLSHHLRCINTSKNIKNICELCNTILMVIQKAK